MRGTGLSMAAESSHTPGADRVKLLIVDDDQSNLLALQAILDPLNQELMLAENGMSALRLCLDHDFAVILLDVRMPELDGFETAEIIRSRDRSVHTPILFLTAYRSDEQLFRGYDLGAVDFLFKPIVPEILQSKINVFVELSRRGQLLQRKAEELAHTEQQFRAVLEAAPDAMIITDQNGVVELVNSRADVLFGYSRELLVGQDMRTLIPDWQLPYVFPGPGETSPLSPELRMTGLRKDGSSFPAEITRTAFSAGRNLRTTTAVRDATEQVEAEARIQRINIELERRVAERTAALTYSNEALRQFAWAASHDLQEPIRTVTAYSQWLAQATAGTLGEREGKMLDIIQEHAHRLNQLLAALRQYVQLSDSGQQEWVRVDSTSAYQSAVWNLHASIDEAGATIECSPLPTIDSVEFLLVQLFQNLISNALKYRSDLSPLIKVSAEAEGPGWLFSVSDNGVGIDSKYFEYIFGVFRRLKGGECSGTGIGLALCRAAVERLGGRIWVESKLGSGSTFYFWLPSAPPKSEPTR